MKGQTCALIFPIDAFDVFSGTEYLVDPNPNCEITCLSRVVALKQSTSSGFSSVSQNFLL